MPKIVFITPEGKQLTVEATVGRTVMQAACDHMVPGILAICGGSCTCGTCLVNVQTAWQARLPAATEDEIGMLDCLDGVQAHSRLSCCIHFTSELDGLVVDVPESTS